MIFKKKIPVQILVLSILHIAVFMRVFFREPMYINNLMTITTVVLYIFVFRGLRSARNILTIIDVLAAVILCVALVASTINMHAYAIITTLIGLVVVVAELIVLWRLKESKAFFGPVNIENGEVIKENA